MTLILIFIYPFKFLIVSRTVLSINNISITNIDNNNNNNDRNKNKGL